MLHLTFTAVASSHTTRPAYPKILLLVLQTAYVRIFRFLTGFFCGCTTNQSKQNCVKGKLFYHSSCKNSMWTHIFNYTDALHSDNFILFTSVKVVLNRRPMNTFSKNSASCVLLLMMPTCPFLNSCCLVGVCFLGFVPSSSSSVSWSHLSPTASHSNPPYKIWLTSIKFQCKVDVHWFNKLFWPIRTGRIFQPWKWLEVCKCQRTITPHQRSKISFAGNKLTCVHVVISVLSGNSVSVFWEIWAYICTASQFPY